MAFRLGLNYFLVITFGFLITTLAAKNSCQDKLSVLGDHQAIFVRCMVDHSAPIAKSCTNCYLSYKNMMDVYKTFIEECSEQYLNKNRLNVAYNMQKTLVEMWDVGFCYDCFDNGTISTSTQKFINLTTDFNNCIQSNISSACQRCQGNYITLNDFYKNMDDSKSGKICFDLQDVMNATRLLWSKELKCCRREFSITLFLVGSSIFGALPLLFYFGMYAHTKRLERNHEVIDSTFDSGNQLAVASTSSGVSSGSIAANVPNEPATSTSTTAVENIEDIKKQKVNLADEGLKGLSSKPTNSKSLITL